MSPTAPSNAAIWYHPEGFDTSGKKLMGRHAAGESFLQAMVQDPAIAELYACCRNQAHFDHFRTFVASCSNDTTKPCHWLHPGQPDQLRHPGTLFYPGPVLAPLAWQRRRTNQRRYSLCGVFHTTCSKAVMDTVSEFLIAPLQRWDAVICTSHSMRTMVLRLLDEWGEYLHQRLGIKPDTPVLLPVIPLGIDTGLFTDTAANTRNRRRWRKKLGIGKKDIMVLFVGRLAYHAKAHPLPMYLGLEQARRETGKRIHLVQAGWFSNEALKKLFIDSAHRFAPSIHHHFLDGRKPDIRRGIWAAADIFSSLSDNIQETFGITPIEAMAAGLPLVASNWDGYRDTIRDGTDGFLVPTAQPPAGTGLSLAQAFEDDQINYDRYVGAAAQHIAVDVAATTAAFTRLVSDAALRRKMGAAGRQRARELYDWSVVLGQYRQLWLQLADRRRLEPETAPRPPARPPNPLRADPYLLYANYPQITILPDSLIVRTPASKAEAEQLMAAEFLTLLPQLRGRELPLQILAQLTETPDRVEALFDLADDKATILRAVGWLAKTGLIRILPPGPGHA